MSLSKVTAENIDPKLKLPPYFPKTRGCTEVANTFFACFEANGKKQHENDTDSG